MDGAEHLPIVHPKQSAHIGDIPLADDLDLFHAAAEKPFLRVGLEALQNQLAQLELDVFHFQNEFFQKKDLTIGKKLV